MAALSAPDSPDSPGGLPAHYFDLYNLAVEMADRISARRVLANSFFATVNTGLAALLGARPFPWYVAAAGVVLAIVWWALLKSYRDLNAAKYRVILAMEELLPAKVFGDEWAALRGKPVEFGLRPSAVKSWLAQYRELGAVERVVPWVFVAIYVIEVASGIGW